MISKNFEKLGLFIYYDFLSLDEESNILSHIEPTIVKNRKGSDRNSVRRYGSNAPYKNQMVSEAIPLYLDLVCDRLVAQNLLEQKPDSVSINEYCVGNGIAPHIDSINSGKTITILSLMSDATMVFSNEFQQFNMKIPRLSITQMKDDIRYKWKHSILPVKQKRYSIVFRNGNDV